MLTPILQTTGGDNPGYKLEGYDQGIYLPNQVITL